MELRARLTRAPLLKYFDPRNQANFLTDWPPVSLTDSLSAVSDSVRSLCCTFGTLRVKTLSSNQVLSLIEARIDL